METSLTEDVSKNGKEKSKLKIHIILFVILGLVIVGLIVGILVMKKEHKTKEIQFDYFGTIEVPSHYWEYFGEIQTNISYAKNNMIENTFGIEGENYNSENFNVNDGKNYIANDKNVYDLFIPHSAKLKADTSEIQGVFLFIHGGAWIQGDKKDMYELCEIYAERGYVTTSMDYSLLNQYNDTNIFRILDEITFCLDSIKQKLGELGLNNLRFAIGGHSAGAHLSLLYTYLIKNKHNIKFVIDIEGPISLDKKNYYILKTNDTLPDLKLSTVEKALKEGKFTNNNYITDVLILQLMNYFTGQKYNEKDLSEMLDKNKLIIENNPKYKELYNSIKNSFPIDIEDKNKIPTLCFYGGYDFIIGIPQYPYLKEKADRDNKILELVYGRYTGHEFINLSFESSIKACRLFDLKVLEYAKKYFI